MSGYAANSEILSYKNWGKDKEEVNILSVVEWGFHVFRNNVDKKRKALFYGLFSIDCSMA